MGKILLTTWSAPYTLGIKADTNIIITFEEYGQFSIKSS